MSLPLNPQQQLNMLWLRQCCSALPLSVAKWDTACYGWIVYTFCLFLVSMASLGLVNLIQAPGLLPTCDIHMNRELYFITSALFILTFLGKICLILATKKASTSSILTLLVFMYGGVTHVLLYTRMDMFLFRSPATGRCVAVIEFLQWQCSCPCLFLCLFSSARKMTERAKTVVLAEHLSIVFSAISVFAPYMRLHVLAVGASTVASVGAKYAMFCMFSPPKNSLDVRLAPYIHIVMVLYFCFPVIYVLGTAGIVTQPLELGLFAFNDVIIKIVYAVLLEFCDSKLYLIDNTDVLDIKKRETIEKAFVRFIFHSVRNPLACITSAIDELGESDAKRMYVRQLRTGMQSLERLLDDLKALIENSSGQARLEEAIVNIPALVHTCTANIDQTAFKIETEHEDAFPLVVGDEYRLSSMIASCAFAAYQKREEGSEIVVRIKSQKLGSLVDITLSFAYEATTYTELQADYEVAPVKLRPETVRREHQLEYAFGLRLAESIADMYMGSVDLRPQGAGHYLIKATVQLLRHIPREPQPQIAPRLTPQKRVLICDDNKVAARLLARVCTNMGIDSDMTYDGKEAINAVKENPGLYFLVITDIVMPCSGLTACTKIIEMEPLMPIYGVSGNAVSTDKQQLIKRGARACFDKPISVELIQSIIEGVLAEGTSSCSSDDSTKNK